VGETEDLTVVSGTQGVSRHDILAAQFTRGSSSVSDELMFTIVTGTANTTPADPALSESDLLSAGDVNQVALFRLVINGTTLERVEQVAPSLPSALGRTLYVGSDEPVSPAEGDLWFVTA